MCASNDRSEYDLIVIGGGPGGSTLGSLVAMQGHRVLLLERESFPRYQIGESLLPATVHGICRLLGVWDEVEAAGFVKKNGAAFRWGTGSEPWIFGFGQSKMLDEIGANYAYQVERSKFDNILLRRAIDVGVTVRERARVERLLVEGEGEGGRVVGVSYIGEDGRQETAHARFVADASGNGSRLYKHAGERIFSKFFRNVAVFGYFEAATRLPAPNSGNILCEAFDKGWMWFIPLSMASPTLTSVGAVLGHEFIGSLQDPEKAMRDAIASCPKVSGLLRDARRITSGQYGTLRVRKDWSYTNERFWKPGFVLIGDAACFIDPVLSTGVHLATYSALLAARSFNSCLRDGLDETLALEEFEARYRLEFGTFYDYLIAFYDMHRTEGSYYWEARKILRTEEAANEAFVRLVAGGATDADVYRKSRVGLGEKLQQFAVDLQKHPGLDRRGEVSGDMASGLQASSEAAPRPVLAGQEDLRRVSWGAKDASVAPGPLPHRKLHPSADGYHWVCSP